MRLKERINRIVRNYALKNNPHFDIQNDFSVIASNCIGGVLYHDCKKRFNSPFINLWIRPADFVKMLKRLDHYLSCDLVFVDNPLFSYPTALLDDVLIFFQHYQSASEALSKWNERKSRIDFDKICVVMSERDGCTYEDLIAFDALPFERKVVFTHKEYPEIKSSFYIKGFENENEIGSLTYFVPHKLGIRYMDSFDFKGFIEG